MQMIKWLCFGMVVCSLLGCGAPATPAPVPSPTQAPAITVAPSAPTATATARAPYPLLTPTSDGRVAAFPGMTIVYVRTGNFVGSPKQWTFYPTGRVVTIDNREHQLSVEQAKRLFEMAQALEGEKLNESYQPTNACADCVTRTLVVYKDGGNRRVSVRQDATTAPTSLTRLLDELERVTASLQ